MLDWIPIFCWRFWLGVIIAFVAIWWFKNKPLISVSDDLIQDIQKQITNAVMPQTSQYNPRSNPFPRNSVKRPTKRRSFASNGEEEVRRVLEDHYQVKFDNCRPNFLKNPETGSNLELDCYNKELKIAAEYQGVQHYRFPNPFHKTKKEFIDQLYRDKIKVKLCEENNVYLIRVPYTVPFNKIKDYVMERIPENYEPSATNTMEEDVSNYYEDQDYTMEEDEYDD